MRRGAQTLAVVGFVASVAIGASGCQTIFSAQQSPATVPAGLAVPSGHSNIVVKRPGGGLGGLLGSIGVHFPANP